MGLIKAQHMSDTVIDIFGILKDKYSYQNIFTYTDGFTFKDESDKEYLNHVAKVGSEEHFFEIKDKLFNIEGVGKDEAKSLCDYLETFQSALKLCEQIGTPEKEPDGSYSFIYLNKLKQLGECVEKLVGENGKDKGFTATLRDFQLKVGFSQSKDPMFKGLSCLSQAIENFAMDYEAGSIQNVRYEAEIREKHANQINNLIEKNEEEFRKLSEFSIENKIYPYQTEKVRKEAKEEKEKYKEPMKQLMIQRAHARSRVESLNQEIKKETTEMNKSVQMRDSMEDGLKRAKERYEEHAKEAQEAFSIKTETVKIQDGVEQKIIVENEAASPEFLAMISKMTKEEIITANLQASEEIEKLHAGSDKTRAIESQRRYLKTYSDEISTENIPPEKLEILADTKNIKALPKEEPIKRLYDNFSKIYEEIHPTADKRYAVTKFFGAREPEKGYDTKFKEIVKQAQIKRDNFIKGLQLEDKLEQTRQTLLYIRNNEDAVKKARAKLVKDKKITVALNTMSDDELFTLENYGVLELDVNPEELKLYNSSKQLISDCRKENGKRDMEVTPEMIYHRALKENMQAEMKALDGVLEDKLNNMKDYTRLKELRAQISAYQKQYQILDEKERQQKEDDKQKELDIKRRDEATQKLAKSEEVYNKIKGEYDLYDGQVKKSEETIQSMRLGIKNAENSKDSIEAQIWNIEAKIDPLNKKIKACDEIDKMAKLNEKLAENAKKNVSVYKQTYPDVVDYRAIRIKKRINEFVGRLDDAKGSHTNTKKFNDMAKKLIEVQTLLATGNGNTKDLQSKLNAVSKAAHDYLAEKATQKLVLGTELRHTRLGFARELESWTKKMAENIDVKCPNIERSNVQRKIMNFDIKEINIPENIGLAHRLKEHENMERVQQKSVIK